jgi:hypothetical protein
MQRQGTTEEKSMKVGATGLVTLLATSLAVFSAGVAFAGPVDSDGDGVLDGADNCPTTFNPSQTNTDVTADPPGDSAGDACDNCRDLCNQLQYDSDSDGCGNICDADVDDPGASGIGDGVVGLPDFNAVVAAFGTTVPPASPDLDIANTSTGCAQEIPDNVVGLVDFSAVLNAFGSPPGPGVPPDTDCDFDGMP